MEPRCLVKRLENQRLIQGHTYLLPRSVQFVETPAGNSVIRVYTILIFYLISPVKCLPQNDDRPHSKQDSYSRTSMARTGRNREK